MDTGCIAILSFVFIFLVHYLVGRLGSGRKGDRNGKGQTLPPSPTAIPFIGHLHLVKAPFHQALMRLAARHGPVFPLRLGSRRAVIVSSPDCAWECFTEHDVTFANRPQFPSPAARGLRWRDALHGSYGPHWRNLRRVVALHLLSTHRMNGMSGAIHAEVRAMVRRMSRAAACGAARVQLKRRLFELSLSVLMETIVQTKTSLAEVDDDTGMSPEAKEFKQIVDEIVPYLGVANLWNYLPVLQWFDVSGVRNMTRAVVRRRDAFLRRLIDSERRRLDDGTDSEKKSMICVLLNLQKTKPEIYSDSMITALCAVSVSSNSLYPLSQKSPSYSMSLY